VISASEALKIILDSIRPLETITAGLEQSSGSILGEEIVAPGDIPPFDNAAMDGFAVRSEDIRKVPVSLTVVGEIAAGSTPVNPLAPGEAMSIMTGAKVPAGCDVGIEQEWTERKSDNRVTILRSADPGHNIRRAGSDIRAATTVFTPGTFLRPQEIGVLASLGKRFVVIHRKPSIAILTTGNEVVEIDKPLPDGKIRNSNAYVLSALIRQLGCEARSLGIATDEKSDLKARIKEGLRADVLITTGGVSVGKYDLVMDALKETGVEIKFWKVNIKPGMPLLFGIHENKPVFGLPGNPVSAMVTFLQFVKPALMRLMGQRTYAPPLRLHARLEDEITKSDGKRHFVRGVLVNANGSIGVRTTGSQVSNILTSLSRADCLIVLPENRNQFKAGEEVEVELL